MLRFTFAKFFFPEDIFSISLYSLTVDFYLLVEVANGRVKMGRGSNTGGPYTGGSYTGLFSFFFVIATKYNS